MRLGHIAAIIVSGVLWFVIGSLLFFKGLFLVAQSLALWDSSQLANLPLLNYLSKYLSTPQMSAMYLIFIAVLIGFLKAKFVLSKTAQKNVSRLVKKPSPLYLKDLFTVSYMILIGFMAMLGMFFRFIPIYKDVKAFIDIAVGFALIYGFILYLKHASALKMKKSKRK